MGKLFSAGYDPTELESNVLTTKNSAAAIQAYQSSGETGLPKVLNEVQGVKTLLQTIGINVDDIEALSNAAQTFLTQIKGYTDTEIASALTLLGEIKGFVDTEMLSAKTAAESADALLKNTTYGLSATKTKLDSIEGTVNTVNGNTATTRETVNSIWSANHYGLVEARNEASYGRVALRTQMDYLFSNFTWGHGNYGQVAARDEATWGRVAIRNRVEDTFGQAQAANTNAVTAKDNAWHAIDARQWIHAATYGGNTWSLPQIRALLDDIRSIAIAARDNAAAANANATTAANKAVLSKATAQIYDWNTGLVQVYSLS